MNELRGMVEEEEQPVFAQRRRGAEELSLGGAGRDACRAGK